MLTWYNALSVNGGAKSTGIIMNFGEAIEALKEGGKVCRSGWNGKGMWLILVGPSEPIVVSGSRYHAAGLEGHTKIGAHIDMFTAAGEMQPGWIASQPDMLADDWEVKD